jgi:flagellar biosynthesis protein
MKTSRSVALQYDPSLPAPFVAARGKGHLADKLVSLAKELDIPVVPAPELTEALFYLEVGDFLPEQFYRVVAELLAFVWKRGESGQPPNARKEDHGK